MSKAPFVFLITWLVVVITALVAYVNHVIWAVSTLMNDATTSQMLLAIFGSILPPLGAVHGVVLWFS